MGKAKTFEVILTHSNYIVRDHHVHGTSILPGVAFLDMIYRLMGDDFATHDIVLQNILFKEPIATTAEFDQKIHVIVEPHDPAWKIFVKSQKIKDNIPLEEKWVDNMECDLSINTTFPQKKINIQKFIKKASSTFDMDDVYAVARNMEIQHDIFMKTLGTIYLKNDFALMELHLSDLANHFLNDFYLHSAFLDGFTFGTSVAYWHFKGKGFGETPYIPFFINEFRAKSALPAVCYVLIPLSKQAAKSKDTISSDLEIYNTEGELIAYFKHLTAKLIRSKVLITQLIAQKTEQSSSQATEASNSKTITAATKQATANESTADIEKYLSERIATLLAKEVDQVSLTEGYYEQGLTSRDLLTVVRDLEKLLNIQLYPTLLFEYTNIKELATYLIREHGIQYQPPQKTVTTADTDKPSRLNESIAIIGMSGRYPLAPNLEQFWGNLQMGKDCVVEIPADRWDYRLYYDETRTQPGKSHSKWGGFIRDHDKFDALFFNISPRDAEILDPQERLFLEVAWQTLEDAGYPPERLNSTPDKTERVSVFVGVMFGLYQLYGVEETVRGHPMAPDSMYASVANLVSYYLGLKGPSMAVDTMCSSSLTSLHLACESIRRGECDLALAGGVNIMSHPQKYLYLSEKKFLSSDGKCRSFGKDGDGYVPGEGVGAVLLKPLSRALQDSDRIYGVIRGSSLNHNGHTNGFTVPSPQAQIELIKTVLQETNIDPKTISYIEAHGTGTSLGDPIEIRGLSKAFEHVEKQTCAIGSVKSNVGHLESAAGIVALTKVLLQMQHQQLVPSIHTTALNPNIDFAKTPFYVQRELSDWRSKPDQPLRASISSFGAGGSNAHVIVEQAPYRQKQPPPSKPAYLLLLSAKHRDVLKQKILDLSSWLKAHPTANLASIAYTLHVGRSHFNHRAALIVLSVEELQEKLRGLAANQQISEYFAGEAQTSPVDKMLYEKILETTLQELTIATEDIYKNKLEALASLYVKGFHIDSQVLYSNERYDIISLPTYPFIKNRYWVPDFKEGAVMSSAHYLHPLVGWNASTYQQIMFKTKLDPSAFYLTDHRVQDTKVLPGACYLEMARSAGELANGGHPISAIRQIGWLKPLPVNKEVEVTIRLTLAGEDKANYEISSGDANNRLVHAKGELLYSKAPVPSSKGNHVQLENILETSICAAEFYPLIAQKGLKYGATFQPLKWIKTNGNEALAYYALPLGLEKDFHQYKLHPTLLDGILQSIVGLVMKTDRESQGLMLPFRISALNIYNTLPNHGYVYVKQSAGTKESATHNLEVWNEADDVILTIDGFVCQTIKEEALANLKTPQDLSSHQPYPETSINKRISTIASSTGTNELVYLQPVWTEQRLVQEENIKLKSVCVWTEDEALLAQLRSLLKDTTVFGVKIADQYEKKEGFGYTIKKHDQADIEKLLDDINVSGIKLSHFIFTDQFSEKKTETPDNQLAFITDYIENDCHTITLFIQQLLRAKVAAPLKAIIFYTYKPQVFSPMSLWSGFNKTLMQEKPDYVWRLVGLDSSQLGSMRAKVIVEELRACNKLAHVRYRFMGSMRQGEIYTPLTTIEQEKDSVLRTEGVYLITGGLGGLGFIFAKFLAKNYRAKLLLTGRTPLDSNKKKALTILHELGGEAEYANGDVADLATVKQWIHHAKDKWGSLHGIIHSAGIIKDALLINKSWDEFNSVLQPKMIGTTVLDEASKAEPLDCFILFSSVSSCFGNTGQSDYASGNSFVDAFATWRAGEVKQGRRFGKCLSINWPLWAEGGMHVDEATQKYLEERTGMAPLPTTEGLQAFLKSVASEYSQLLVVYGKSTSILNYATSVKSEPASDSAIESDTVPAEGVPQNFIYDLQKLIGSVVKLAPGQVSTTENLGNYGFDSVAFTDLSVQIKHDFTLNVAPTLYFEHPTIEQIATYLWKQHRSVLSARYPQAATKSSVLAPEKIRASFEKNSIQTSVQMLAIPPAALNTTSLPETGKIALSAITSHASTDDIAIIGMSGLFPGSANLNSFWENLIQGKDLISEIPKSRWHWESLYGEESNQTKVKWGGFIEGIDEFDAGFFNIPPVEAELMDPQQRLFLETVWKAMEDAGYSQKDLSTVKTGIFVGVASHDYAELLEQVKTVSPYTTTGNAHSVLANRLSYILNLSGPSEAIDTACSSSLVAIHHAIKAIQNHDCELAIAGGVNAILTPTLHLAFSKAGMLCEDGRCKTFDKTANGYVRGEGVGAIILKPLAQALADGNTIYGVIKGSAVNHGGKVSSLTVPNPNAQAEVIVTACERGKIDVDTISYIEAHGTGTSLGDPIEINGLEKAFQILQEKQGKKAQQENYCGLGSVKTNIGHLEAAAGIAGVIKVLLAMQHGKLPATLHFDELNPFIEINNSPFYIVENTREWQRLKDKDGHDVPRRAGISAFGFGGANAHLVFEEAPFENKNIDGLTKPYYLITLSAKTSSSLKQKLIDLEKWLLDPFNLQHASLENVSYTLNVGRKQFDKRCAFVVASIAELTELLANVNKGQLPSGYLPQRDATVNEHEPIFDEILNNIQKEIYQSQTLESTYYRKKLLALGDLYTKGYDLEWENLHRNETHKRVALPVYPFVKKRYWCIPQSLLQRKDTFSPVRDKQYVLLEKTWQSSSIMTGSSVMPSGKFIVLVNQATSAIAEKLFTKIPSINPVYIQIDANQDVDMAQWVDGNQSETTNFVGIMDLSDLLGDRLTLWRKIALLQVLMSSRIDKGFVLFHFTLGLQSCQNSPTTYLGAEMNSLLRVLSAEYSKFKIKNIDIDTIEFLEQSIRNEFKLDDNVEVCYRNELRYFPQYQKLLAESVETTKITLSPLTLSKEKVYVITGGTRGIGNIIAHYLVARGARRLVLMGLQSFPDRSDWDLILEQADDSPIKHRIKNVLELEKAGAKIELYTGSLTNHSKLQNYFNQIRSDLGEIGGVVHCAGLVNYNEPVFIDKKIEDIQSICEPKIAGLMTLHEIFKLDKLEFFILFSSISAAVPRLGVGISDYAMANGFMDYFAAYQFAQGYSYYHSIAWPSWKDTGIGEVRTSAYTQLNLIAHNNEEGLHLLEKVLSQPDKCSLLACVVNHNFNSESLIKPFVQSKTSIINKPMKLGMKVQTKPLDWLVELFSRQLKMPLEELEPNIPFGDYGVDSILLAALVKKIEQHINTKLDPSVFLEYPTLNRLSQYLTQTYNTAVPEERVTIENIPDKKSEVKNTVNPSHQHSKKIAVIGIACHFPLAPNKDAFWKILESGTNCITEVPASRWRAEKFYRSEHESGKSISKWGGFIENIENFDPAFFSISNEDAPQIDPLERQFLEVAAEVLADAGYKKKELWNKNVGVFVGARVSNYSDRISQLRKNTIVGLGQNFIAAHVSHVFNFTGPSLVVDTACSSSLVSIHMACQSLQSGECELAVVGGVEILLDERPYLILSEAQALSPDGKCHTFDESANGFVPGEGCGAVLLKPLDQAIQDGDHIYAVIEATAVNNDGHTMGITTPNPEAQQKVIQEALRKANIHPETVSYIEAHGTGTMIGDPIELRSLTNVFGQQTSNKQFCAVGTVKSNVGHLLSAAGIASFIKVVLSLHHKKIVPTLNCTKPNPRFDFANSPFYPNMQLQDWQPIDNIRRAGINSFGFGGTNAHCILSEFDKLVETRIRQSLPPIVFERQYHWLERPEEQPSAIPWTRENIISALFEPAFSKKIIEKYKKYETILTFDNYIVRDHRVHGMRVLPGVVLLNIIYEFMSDEFPNQQIILRNVIFKEPVIVTEEFDKKIMVNVNKHQNYWKITINNQKIKNGMLLDSTVFENAECELYLEEKKTQYDHLDIENIKSSATNIHDMDIIYSYARKVDIIHQSFMKALGNIYQSPNDALMAIVLGELSQQYVHSYYMHPVFLDAATFARFAASYSYDDIAKMHDSSPYIPFFIEEFRINSRTPKDCYVYTARNEAIDDSKDIVKTDLKAYDDQGQLIFLMQGLVVKKIRTKELITQLGISNTPIPIQNNSVDTTTNINPKAFLSIDSASMEVELIEMVARKLNKSSQDVGPTIGFYDLGLDSKQLLEIVKDLELRLNRQLYPTLLFEHNTIQLLAKYLAGQEIIIKTDKAITHSNIETDQKSGIYHYKPVWKKLNTVKHLSLPTGAILIIDDDDDIYTILKNKFPQTIIHHFKPSDFNHKNDYIKFINTLNSSETTSMADALATKPHLIIYRTAKPSEQQYYHLLQLSQALIQLKWNNELTLLCVNETFSPFNIALKGFLQTLHLEYPKIITRSVTIQDSNDLLNELYMRDADVRYDQEHVRWVNDYQEIEQSKVLNDQLLRQYGVYLITGGAGGLGQIFARYMAEHYHAKLILIGRSGLQDKQKSMIADLEKFGAEVLYISADVANKNELAQAIIAAKKRFGTLNGIIHSAGVLHDSLIIKKTIEESQQVFAPKINGTIYLDSLTKSEPLDFFVMFSSTSAVFGNIGQCDYAYANAFMDGYASNREKLRTHAKRSGQTISINWPLWEAGGMQIDEVYKAWAKKTLGTMPLSTTDGIHSFITALNQEYHQQIILVGQQENIEQTLNATHSQLQMVETPQIRSQDIAIIGISGRYPQASDLETFWENLKSGKDCITEIPKERWDYHHYFDPDKNKHNKSYSKWGGFMEDVDKFDPLFFNISPITAEIMDPQERLFLETTWKTVENAGYTPESLANKKIGVFVGVMYEQYQLYGVEESLKGNVTATGFSHASIANRVSYYFNFRGPSIGLDTMCSSSLTAIHLACKSILEGECQLAIAGGVNITIHPSKYIFLSRSKLLSSDGRCRSFGEGGDGYVPSEGVGAILLKPLQQALDDRDYIYGVIKGIGINHSGKTSGFAVPDPVAQATLIEDVYAAAQIDPTTVSYMEAMSVGTSLGDQIEIDALNRVFKANSADISYSIGSVKSNIGHCESAAGIAAVTKVLLQMQHQNLVPSLHSETLNSSINWNVAAFKVQHTLSAWQRPCLYENGISKQYPRRAGISSFGAGGSNTHMIIEEAPSFKQRSPLNIKPAYILTLSAKTEDALRQRIKDLEKFIIQQEQVNLLDDTLLEDICYTLNNCRAHFDKRCAIIVSSIAELLAVLKNIDETQTLSNVFMNVNRKEKPKNKSLHSRLLKQIMIELSQSHALSENDYRENLSSLADLYVDGYNIDWSQIYKDVSGRKIPLPTYPFAKERYWITKDHQPLAQNQNFSLDNDVSKKAKTTQYKKERVPTSKQNNIEAFIMELKDIIGNVLKIEPQRLNIDANLTEYGMDSIIFTKLTFELNHHLGLTIEPTLYLEYPTISLIGNYLWENNQELLLLRKQAKHQRQTYPSIINNFSKNSPEIAFEAEKSDIALASKEPAYKINIEKLPKNEKQFFTRTDYNKPMELSFAQERMFLLTKVYPNATSYNVPLIIELYGDVEIEVLQKSLNTLIKRHKILSTYYINQQGNILQVIDSNFKFPIELIDITQEPNVEKKLNELIKQYSEYSFDLEKYPAVLAALITRSKYDHLLILTFHHIVTDAISNVILISDLTNIYSSHINNKPIDLPPTLQYADFAALQRQSNYLEVVKQRQLYWKNRLINLKSFKLPTDFELDSTIISEAKNTAYYEYSLENKVNVAIGECAKREQCSPFNLFYMAYLLLCFMKTRQTDISIAIPFSGREQYEVQEIIGMFAEPVIIRLQLNEEESARVLLKKLSQTIQEAYKNFIPLNKIIEVLNQKITTLHLIFDYIHMGVHQETQFGKAKMTDVIIRAPRMDFDIFWVICNQKPNLKISLSYNPTLFKDETIKNYVSDYQTILNLLVNEDLDKPITDFVLKRLESTTPPKHVSETKEEHPIILCSNFTIEPIESSVHFWQKQLNLPYRFELAGYNQIFQELMDPSSLFSHNHKGVNIILLRFEDWQHYQEEEINTEIDLAKLENDVDMFKQCLTTYLQTKHAPLWIIFCPHSPKTLLNLKIAKQLRTLENKFMQDFHKASGVHFVPSDELLMNYPVEHYDEEQGNHLAHIPYTPSLYTALATLVTRKITSLHRPIYKVIAVDCDNTLWRGVCGEVGPLGIEIDEGHQALQRFLIEQSQAGKLICLCSKNVEEDVFAVFDQNPKMVLKRGHLTTWRVNWQDKSSNLFALAKELQLGIDSFIFLDDNPIECAEVQARCPNALTLALPQDPNKFLFFLHNIWAFDHGTVTAEDKKRTEMYKQNIEREKLRQTTTNFADFLSNLKLKVTIENPCEVDIPRVSQLTQRTNQFNTTTLRRTEPDVKAIISAKDQGCFTVKVVDRFGDYGLVGEVFYKIDKDAVIADSIMLSCRVLGRGVEHHMIAKLGEIALDHHCAHVVIPFITSAKNQPMRDFMMKIAKDYAETTDQGFNFKLPAEIAKKIKLDPTAGEESPVVEESGAKKTSGATITAEEAAKEYDIIINFADPNKILDQLDAERSERPEMEDKVVSARTVTEEKLTKLFQEVLRIKTIGIHDDFFALGGNSLTLISLLLRINADFDMQLTHQNLLDINTIAGLAQFIDHIKTGKAEVEAPSVFLDLEKEVVWDFQLPKNWKRINFPPKNILLTGATGFLGAYLLHDLLKATKANIVCLVRADNEAVGLKRIKANLNNYGLLNEKDTSRIIPLIGDLEKPSLGLTPEKQTYLCDEIDTIYHNGALVNFVFSYHALKNSNVIATQEIIKIASTTRLKPIHYVSTVAIFDSLEYLNAKNIDEMTPLPLGNTVFGGYSQSKWVAEKMIERAKGAGIPITIYRPGTISGDSRTGEWQISDALSRIFKYIILSRVAPDVDNALDMVPVNYVSHAIVKLSLRRSHQTGEIFHLVNPNPLSLQKTIGVINKYYPIKLLNYQEWKEHLVNQAKKNPEHLLYRLLPLFNSEIKENLTFAKAMTQRPTYTCDFTASTLKLFKISCTPLRKLILIYLDKLIKETDFENL